MQIIIIPARQDNYSYLLIDDKSKKAALIDPVNSAGSLEQIKKNQCDLQAIYTTHWHEDHAGGNKDIIKEYPKVPVFGEDRVDKVTHVLSEDGELNLGEIQIKHLLTPGHTRHHMCYYVEDKSSDTRAVFTGDW